MEVLTLKNITKEFNGRIAVDNLSFTLHQNHVIGFLGPNGAGKTTTLRIIVGFSTPTKGAVSIFGSAAPFGDSFSRRDIGYLPEQPALYSWMTANEYLSFFAEIYDITGMKKDKRIDELLEIVNLRDFKNRKIGTFSNGMKQRIGIAQAILNNPKLLLLDEPVSALDPIGRKEVLKMIEQIKENSTVLFSTHILSDVDRICDDVIILNKGKLVANAPLNKLKEDYSSKILTIEFETSPKKILKALAEQKWLERYEANDRILRIWLKDKKTLDVNAPLNFLLSAKIGIVKYEFSNPEIEDLFIDLLATKHD